MEKRVFVGTPVFKPYSWEEINLKTISERMDKIWWYSVPICAIYIGVIHYIQHAMSDRKPIKLRGLLFLWNLLLAVFSIVGTIRVLPELFAFIGQPNGFHGSMCSREYQTMGTAFWSLMSAYSKVAELGDTIFVVLKKQPLIFLHWYHHTTVLLFTWFTFTSLDPSNRWMMAMNYFIHAVMYSYYALKALGFRIPKWLSIGLTTMQTTQMVIGVSINVYTFVMKLNGVQCERRNVDVLWGTLMYISYMVLFSQFFYRAYLKKPAKKRE